MAEEEPEKRNSAILPADSLVVVNVPMSQIESEKLSNQRWWRNLMVDRAIWVASVCSGVTLITTKEHWDEHLATHCTELTTRCMTQKMADDRKKADNPDPFTLAKNPYFLKKEGWDAYNYLLQVVCGLHSSDLGEDHISHQILDQSYKIHKRNKHNNHKTEFDSIVAALQHDYRQVRNVIGDYTTESLEDTAKELTELKAGEKVLVVTDRWEYAKKMLFALGRDAVKTRPSAIDVAHIAPKSGAIDSLNVQIAKMKQENSVYSKINMKAESLTDILDMGKEWLQDYQAIIIVSELDGYPKQENELIKLWQHCGQNRPKFVAMRFNPSTDEGIMPHPELKEEPGAVVLLPDRIQETYKEKKLRCDNLLAQGNNACGLCTTLRQEGIKPIGKWLNLDYEGYMTESEKYYSLSPSEKRIYNKAWESRRPSGYEGGFVRE